jgi:hypothetical protein
MMKGQKIPNYLWAEAVNYANDLKNMSPTKLLKNTTPYEAFYKKKPNYNNLKTFGSKVEFKDNNRKSKLEDRTTTGIYLGYDSTQHSSKIFVPATMRITHARNAEVTFHEEDANFFEQDKPDEPKISEEEGAEKEIIYLDDDDEEEEEEPAPMPEPLVREQVDQPMPHLEGPRPERPQPGARREGLPAQGLRRQQRQQQPQSPAPPEQRARRVPLARQQREFDRRMQDKIVNNLSVEEAMLGEDFDEAPRNYQEVLVDENKKEWIEAMKKEVENLYENDTFELVNQPNNNQS